MNRYDRVSSLAWLMASLAIIVGSSSYSFGKWSHPGPGFLPMWCGIIMAVFAVAIFIQATLQGKREVAGEQESPFLTSRWPKLVAVLIIVFAYAFLLETLGFLLITLITMVSLLRAVEMTRWKTALVEAGLATFISYALFELWLKVPLPKGFWPSLF